MKTIIIATDFSPAAMNAANYAADMAVEIHAGILLFHVYQIPVVYQEVAVAMNDEILMEDVQSELSSLKEKLTLRTKGKVMIETEVRTGTFFSELENIAEKIKPYVVVMGSQGTTAAERFFLGGHTVYAMQHLKWPVMTLPDTVTFSAVKKIGLACDLNNPVGKIPISQIKAFVLDFHSALYVINNGEQEVFDPEIIFEADSLADRLAPVIPNYGFMTSKDPYEGIMTFAAKNEIDMLIVLQKEHGLLYKLVHSSHTKRLVLHSQIPVLALQKS